MTNIIAFLLLCSCVLTAGCKNQQLYTDNRVMMGTIVETTSVYKEASGIVFSEMERIDGLLSKYKPDSEVSELNRSGKLNASPDTFSIIKKAKEFWQASGGAFDITVAPLLDLWGFTNGQYCLPREKEIKNTLKLIGSDKIILREDNSVVEFRLSGMKIDLGAIAKGYALDCAADKLRKAGIKSCLINAGGQVYALGDKFGKPWKIAIKGPRGGNFIGYLELKNKSAATSGDYEQYFIKNNTRYQHIINPKTGYPANSGIVSVTVIASDGLTADCLSTAIFVLGKEKGKALAKSFSTEVKIIEDKGGS
ncbi:MAG: FAD:protein FMN transferase [Candidatus Omnitrophota bacterium]